jgi:Kef-type K+ transport system membrane component KefB
MRTTRSQRWLLPLLVMPLLMGAGNDPIAAVALHLAIVLVAAKLGGEVAVRAGQPAVLGELLAGVALGNAPLLGVTLFAGIAQDPAIVMLAGLGVLVLLFEVGLEETVGHMLQVGVTAALVAVAGVAAPFALGWLVGQWLLPDANPYVHAFLGATLCATSVGITARVLQDLRQAQTREARIILGAAVIDDVLGLIILAVVTGLITAAAAGTTLGAGDVLLVIGKAGGFLLAAIVIGVKVAPRMVHTAWLLRAPAALLGAGLAFCFVTAWLASLVGLAPIIGAFAAGLVLEHVHYQEFRERGDHGLEELVKPISDFLVPVFFVLMGLQTDLRAFTAPGVLGLAAALTVAAVIGKMACALPVPRGTNRLAIGIGMAPRGEVGLIFANIGLALTIGGAPVISPPVYSAIVVMVIVTTMLTPPGLKWSLGRRQGRPAA